MKNTIIASIILVGAAAMGSQIVFMRELLVVFSGNEFSVALIMASWLIAYGAGSILMGYLSRIVKARTILFVICQIALSALLPLTIFAISSLRSVIGLNPGEIMPLFPMSVSSLIILLPICILFGFIFSLAVCVYRPEPRFGAARIGEVYIFEAIGALFSGLITSFLLIKFLSSVYIMAIFSILLITSALGILIFSDKSIIRKILLIFGSIILLMNILLCASGGWARIDNFFNNIKWRGYELIASENSIYSNIVIAKELSQYSFFDNGLHLYTIPDKARSEEAVHFALLEHPNPKKVLLIGGGVGGLLSEIEKHPVERIDYVELDPLIIEMAKSELPEAYKKSLDDKRVRIIFEDGRSFVRRTGERYDVVMMNFGNPYTAQINRYYTIEFFNAVRAILKDGGVFSFGLSSSESFIGRELRELLRSIYATLGKVFDDIKIVPGETAYFLASVKPLLLTYDYKVLMQTARQRGVQLEYVREYYLSSKMSDELIKYTEGVIRNNDEVIINRDFKPISYYYGIITWASHFRDSVFNKIFRYATARAIWSIGALSYLAIFITGYFFAARKRMFSPSVKLMVMSNGFSQMAFQVIVLLSFQMIYGYMFYKLGIILTVFMAGLALGGWSGIAALGGESNLKGKLMALQGLLSAYPIILAGILWYLAGSKSFLVSWIGANIIFVILPFAAGFIGGAIFPLANKLSLINEDVRGRVGGMNYGIDLFGSCVGALATGVFLVPILGIPGTCLAIAILNFTVLLVLKIGADFS